MADALGSLSILTVIGGIDDQGSTNPTIQALQHRRATASRIQNDTANALMEINPGPPSTIVSNIGKKIDAKA